jgi:hypothetical protein
MATKTKKQNKSRAKSPHKKSSDRRTTIESRDLNEDEQSQITNSTAASEEDAASDNKLNSNFTAQDERDDDMAKGTRERRDQMQEDDKEHKGEEQ